MDEMKSPDAAGQKVGEREVERPVEHDQCGEQRAFWPGPAMVRQDGKEDLGKAQHQPRKYREQRSTVWIPRTRFDEQQIGLPSKSAEHEPDVADREHIGCRAKTVDAQV